MSFGWAATIFVNPETTYVTTGSGAEFSFTVEADSTTSNLFGYHVKVKYDKNLMNSVVVTEGPLLASGGGTTVFFGGVDSDSTHIEGTSAILGGSGVNGLGVLFTVTVRTSGSGIYNIDLDTIILRDTSNSPIPTTPTNGIAYINLAPSNFNLQLPADGDELFLCPSESLLFDWQNSTSPYPGNLVRYALQYGTSSGFAPESTTTIGNLSISQHKVLATSFQNNSIIYWRVKAFDQFGFIKESTPFLGRDFMLNLSKFPMSFDLLFPLDDTIIQMTETDTVFMDWQNSLSPCVGVPIFYDLFISKVQSFLPESTVIVVGLNASEYKLSIDTLNPSGQVERFWKVRAYDSLDLETWSNQTDWSFILLGCSAIPGDVDADDKVNVVDLVYFANVLFKSWNIQDPACRADVNAIGGLSLSDIVFLANFIFKQGPPPMPFGACCLPLP